MFFLSCGYEGPHLDLSEFFSGLTIGRIVFDGIYFWQRKTISLLFFFQLIIFYVTMVAVSARLVDLLSFHDLQITTFEEFFRSVFHFLQFFNNFLGSQTAA